MVSDSGPVDLEERIACLEMLLSCKEKVPSDLNVLECLHHLQGHWSRVFGSLPSEVRDVLRVTDGATTSSLEDTLVKKDWVLKRESELVQMGADLKRIEESVWVAESAQVFHDALEQKPMLDALSLKVESSKSQTVTEDIWAFVRQYHDWVC